jgi:hypothetical protein
MKCSDILTSSHQGRSQKVQQEEELTIEDFDRMFYLWNSQIENYEGKRILIRK